MNNLFNKILVCLFLFLGTAKLFSFPINDINDWNNFMSEVATTGGIGRNYTLMDDVGTPTSTILSTPVPMITGTFRGSLDGNNKKIYVRITSAATNVGLFSELSGAIFNLIVDGSVTGLVGSQNVGGIAGLVETGSIEYCTNLADVICSTAVSSVGGIAGRIVNSAFNESINNGSISGGQYVAGVVGVSMGLATDIKYCKNAGTIQRLAGMEPLHQSYIAGIVAYCSSPHIYCPVNIGRILSNNFTLAGGIAAYLENGVIRYGSNSGIVDGAINFVGGIAGYVGNRSIVEDCINTNWVEPLGTAGAIVGDNNGSVMNCYFDEQMCVVGGVGGGNPGVVTGLQTAAMLGINLQGSLNVFIWDFENNLYPRPIGNLFVNHPINLLSAAPIYLQRGERVDNVMTNFFVSNGIYLPIYNYPYLWGWFIPTFKSYSFDDYVEIQTPNDARIRIPMGWDTLAVRFDYPNYGNNGLYPGHNIIFEKIVPIYMTR